MATVVTHRQVAQAVVAAAYHGAALNALTRYTQGPERWSGIDHHVHYPRVPPAADCSAWASWLFWDARIRRRGHAGTDLLNGLGWQAGNTDTMIIHGRRHRGGVEWWFAGRTLLFYGGPKNGSDPEHVAVWVGNGLVATHGRDAGPEIRGWKYRLDFVQARAYAI